MKQSYEQHVIPVKEAIGHIKKGDNIYIEAFCSEPQHLINELIVQKERLNGSTLYLNVGGSPLHYAKGDCTEHFRYRAFLSSFKLNALTKEADFDYIPINLSDIPRYYEENDVDVALIQVSPPNEDGYCCLGITVESKYTLINEAKVVIAEVNDQMPITYGDTKVHISKIDWFVKSSKDLIEIKTGSLSEIDRKIGEYAASIIPDRATLQWGIGNIPSSILTALSGKQDLGVHTGSITDAAIELYENGTITDRYKGFKDGVSVSTAYMGSKRLYAFADRNKKVELHPSSVTHNPAVMSQVKNLYSINSAIAVDIFGHINSETIAGNTIAGVGGQMDFIKGAKLSPGGRSIIALPSTTTDGSISKITFTVERTSSTKADVDYIVTEYGIASLFGKTLKERAEALIAIAHPKFRADLKEQYEKKYNR